MATRRHICGPDLEDSDPTEQPEIDLSPEDVVPWKIGRPGRPGIVDMDAWVMKKSMVEGFVVLKSPSSLCAKHHLQRTMLAWGHWLGYSNGWSGNF